MIKAQAVRNKYEKAPTARALSRLVDSAGRICLGVANAVAVGWCLAAVAAGWGIAGQILGAHSQATAGEMVRPFFFLFDLVVTL